MKVVGRLASQTAAHKLVQMMGMLFIPFVVLLALYFFKAKAEIDAVRQQQAGVALAQFAISAPKILLPTQQKTLRDLEHRAGIAPPESLLARQQTVQTELRARSTYLTNVGRVSRVLLDAEGDIRAPAEVAFELAPTYAAKLQALADVGIPNLSHASFFSNAAFELNSMLKRLEGNAGPSNAALVPFQTGLQTVDRVSEKLSASDIIRLPQEFDSLKKSAADVSTSGVRTLQGQALGALAKRLKARTDNLWRNLAIIMFAGCSSALTGIGLAVLTMRSALLRLDELELARKDAVAARTEAESISLRFTAINADISRLNQDMAQKVNELKAAQDELVKKGRMEQLGQLIATIAHEVRNPLGAIRTTIFMVERKIADKNLGLEGHLQRINNSVNRCDTIISQLLDYSRTKEINSSPILLDEWIAKIVREEAARLPDNILIECALGMENETVNIDPSRMQRAVVNLLSNAADALLCQQDRQGERSNLYHHIWVSTKRLGEFVVIRIADNGPGIAAEYIQKIREPLFTTKSFGTGLGIPAVEQVVTQHGGRLDISSDIGKGAVFSIYIPLSRNGMKAA